MSSFHVPDLPPSAYKWKGEDEPLSVPSVPDPLTPPYRPPSRWKRLKRWLRG